MSILATPTPLKVEDYLNQTNYTVAPGYVPSDFALEFITFIKLVNGNQGEEHLTPLVHYYMLDTLTEGGRRVVNLCHRGIAKALSLDTRLPTPAGWTTVADIQIGDFIFGEDGKPAPVLNKSAVFNKPMYRLVLADGRELKVSEDHINTVIHQRQKRVEGKRVNYLDRRDMTTKELLAIPLTTTRNKTNKNPKGKENRVWLPLPKPVQYPECDLPIDPYTLGLAIGDGSMDRATGYCRLHGHVDDLPRFITHIPTECGPILLDKRFPSVGRVGLQGLGSKLKALGLNCHGNDKFVPEQYKLASVDQRLALLQGLMDTDGTAYVAGCTSFTSNSLQLVKDVQELVWSLGGNATYAPMEEAYRCNVRLNLPLFRLPRKLERQHMKAFDRIPLVAIEPITQEPSQCLMVGTPERTFLAGDYVVTHNTTVMGEYLFLYLATYGELPGFGVIDLALYVSDSIENGVKNMRKNLEFRWDNSAFLQQYVPRVRFTDIRWEFENADGKIFIVKGYGAKALSLDSELHTLTGRITIGECKVGDRIFGADGKLTTITAKSEIFHKPMYRLQLADGHSLKVSEDHLNPVVINTNPNNTVRWEEKVLTTLELLQQPLTHTKKGNLQHRGTSTKSLVFVKNIEALEYPEAALPIDPYTLGAVIGDGHIRKDCGSVELTVHADELPHYHTQITYEFGALYKDPRSNAVTQSIRGLGRALKAMELNVRGEYKFIPHEYFLGSIAQRLSLLQGLMDTDGTVSENGRLSFTSSSHQLVDDLACLVRSLGGTAAKICKHSSAEAYRVELWMEVNPFRLPRKAARFVAKQKHTAVVSIKQIADEPSQCIAVDNEERQFVADCYFRTHNTGVRGAKEMGKRPQLAVLDDLISDEDARSVTVIAAVEDTVYKAVNYALHPTKNMIIWSGTPFNAKDPLYKAVESGAWSVNVFPVCEQYPCSKEDFRGSWPDRFTYEYVKEQYDSALLSGKVETFNQELMLRIMSDEDRMIQDGDIGWYKLDAVIRNKNRFNFYITTDFATSIKQKADFSVISVWAYNNVGDWLWVDGVCKRQLMDANINDLFRLAQSYKPQSVGIEVTGQQGGFIQWIQNEMMERNIYFPLASEGNDLKPGIRPNTNKLVRFNTMVPMFKARKMFFPVERKMEAPMQECINELSLASISGFRSKHDDFIDTISMLASLTPWKPSEEAPMHESEKGGGMWELDVDSPAASRMSSYIV